MPNESDRNISALASLQHGVVSRRQLLALGLSRDQVQSRIDNGLLSPLLPGVYSFGHRALTLESRWTAATLTASTRSVLSHRSAAALWEIGLAPSPVEVIRQGGGRNHPGLLVHSARTLTAEQVTKRKGIPVTTVERTLIDLAGVVPERRLADAFSAARRHGVVDLDLLASTLDQTRGRKGTGELRSILDSSRPSRATRSELESRFLLLCLREGLPRPEVDVSIGRRVVDFLWRQQRVIVEIDSREFHMHRMTEDRSRDLDHLALGYETVRVTHRMIEDDPAALMFDLGEILAARTQVSAKVRTQAARMRPLAS